MEKLNTSFQAASQDMYNATQGAAETPEQPKKDDNKNEEEVTDVDFEEV